MVSRSSEVDEGPYLVSDGERRMAGEGRLVYWGLCREYWNICFLPYMFAKGPGESYRLPDCPENMGMALLSVCVMGNGSGYEEVNRNKCILSVKPVDGRRRASESINIARGFLFLFQFNICTYYVLINKCNFRCVYIPCVYSLVRCVTLYISIYKFLDVDCVMLVKKFHYYNTSHRINIFNYINCCVRCKIINVARGLINESF